MRHVPAALNASAGPAFGVGAPGITISPQIGRMPPFVGATPSVATRSPRYAGWICPKRIRTSLVSVAVINVSNELVTAVAPAGSVV